MSNGKVQGSKPVVIKRLNIGKTAKSKGVLYWRYNFKKNVNIYDVKRDIQEMFSKNTKEIIEMKKMGIKIMIGLHLDQGWRSGPQFNIGDNVMTYYDDKYANGVEKDETTNGVYIVFIPPRSKAGGCNNDTNDCLFDECLRPAFYKVADMPKKYNTSAKLKEALGFKRNDLIPFAKISTVESLYQININVSGAQARKSNTNYTKSVDVRLIDNHYSLHFNNSKAKELRKFYSFKSRNIIMVSVLNENKYEFYDGKRITHATPDQYKITKREKRNENLYIFTNKRQITKWVDCENGLQKCEKENVKDDIKTQYINYIKSADTLLELSKGEINLYKGEYVDIAKELFLKLGSHIKET